MKKYYKGLIILLLSLSFNELAFSQLDYQVNHRASLSDRSKEILNEIKKRKQTSELNKLNCDDTITTPLLGGNGHAGVMFDVSIGQDDLTLETFWVAYTNGILPQDSVSIYYKTGSFVGFETNSSAWTFLGGAYTPTSFTLGGTKKVPLNLSFPLINNNTYAFYVTTNNFNSIMLYSNGTVVGNVLASNSDLTIYEGNGGDIFNVNYSPRTFNGKIQYCKSISTGNNENISNNIFSIYPNPTNGELNFTVNNNQSSFVSDLIVYNVVGKTVLEKENKIIKTNNKLDISFLESGIYFLKMNINGEEYISKFIKR